MDLVSVAKRVFNDEINSLALVRENIGEEINSAIDILKHSTKVLVFGIGKSGNIARKIAHTFSSIGVPAFFIHPVEALHGDIGVIKKGDAAILISKSGSTEDIVKIIPFLRKREVKVISLVGNMESYIARMSDAVLNTTIDKEACPVNLAPMTSTTAALVYGDALAVCLMELNGFKLEDFAFNHPHGQIGRNTTLHVSDVMHKGDTLPLVEYTDSFKDALIEISQKGLGCVCVVGKDDKLVGIITDGDVRRILQMYDDLKGLSVQDVMTKNPISVKPDVFLGVALSIMEERVSQISVLPVKNESGSCVGLVRIHDIIGSVV